MDVEFNIDDTGTARNVMVAKDANPDFARVALAMLEGGGFRLPPEWDRSGGPKRVLAMEFRFELAPRGPPCSATHAPPRIAGAQVMTICAAAIR